MPIEKLRQEWWNHAMAKNGNNYDPAVGEIANWWLDKFEDHVKIILLEREKEISVNIGMLRQWLNEDRIDDLNKMVTNEQIQQWLQLLDIDEK